MESGRRVSKEEYKWQLRDGWIPDQDYVFVSYASRDWEKVYPCVMALRARGINVYIDIEFMENQSSNWLENFQERLFRDSGCKGIVSFLSIDYMRSYACLVEQMANRTGRMRRHAGRLLPVFYVALEPELSTLQQMSTYIYDSDVRRESTRERVEISPPEYTVLQRFILDSSISAYPDVESVRELLDDIRDKHDVVINMYELVFSDTRYMPSIQLFEGVEKCAQLLADNFLNDKNNSIKMTMLEDLRQRTCEKLGLDASEQDRAEPENLFGSEQDHAEPEEPSGPEDRAEPERPSSSEQDHAEPERLSGSEQDHAEPEGPSGSEQDHAEPERLSRPEQDRAEPERPSESGQRSEEPEGAPEREPVSAEPEGPSGSEQSTGQQREQAMPEIVCPSCKKINRGGSRFCTRCGLSFALVQLCDRCGAALKPGKRFCSQCGARVK